MLLDAASWAGRDARFTSLIGRPKYIGMELAPRIDASWPHLRDKWIALPRHGNLLDAIAPSDRGVIVRYAALDWSKRFLRLEPTTQRTVAAFGAQLAGVFELLLERVHGPDLGLFLQPFAYIDIDDELRVGFEPGASMRPPEMKLDERAFIFVIGRLWTTMLDDVPRDGVGKIIRRCVDTDRRARFKTFDQLRNACFDLSAPIGLRSGERLCAWYRLEEALGWRSLGQLDHAHRLFEAAAQHQQYRKVARQGWAATLPPPVEPPAPPSPPPVAPAPPSPPSPARASYLEGRAHFLARRFHEAQICFASAILLDPMMLEAQLLRREVDRAIARTRARAGTANAQPIDVPASLRDVRDLVVAGRIRDAIAALDELVDNPDAPLFRARLLALDGQYDRASSAFASIDSDEAKLGLARVTIDRGKPEVALAIVDELVATHPRDLGVLEVRARCLELLGRGDEANEAMKALVAAVEVASPERPLRP